MNTKRRFYRPANKCLTWNCVASVAKVAAINARESPVIHSECCRYREGVKWKSGLAAMNRNRRVKKRRHVVGGGRAASDLILSYGAFPGAFHHHQHRVTKTEWRERALGKVLWSWEEEDRRRKKLYLSREMKRVLGSIRLFLIECACLYEYRRHTRQHNSTRMVKYKRELSLLHLDSKRLCLANVNVEHPLNWSASIEGGLNYTQPKKAQIMSG